MSGAGTPSSIQLAIHGLILNPSTFGNNAPPGALSVADNVVIDRPSVVETRRGFDNSFYTLPGSGVSNLLQFNNTQLLNTTDGAMMVDLASNGVFTTYTGDYHVPNPNDPASKVRGIETNRNFYFITRDGTYRLDNVYGQPRPAGAPAGLSGYGIAFAVGPTGAVLLPETAVAYRVVFGYRDSNKQLVLGAPSSRIVVENTSVTDPANTTITFQLPKEVQLNSADFIYQLYRGNPSPNLATPPDDEMSLIFEDVCIGAATITVDDITPKSLATGAALYTNQGQEGILQSNYRPPWAADVCTFKQYAFYANTRTAQVIDITLIGAGAGNGATTLHPGDTITFTASELGGATFTLTATNGGGPDNDGNNYALGQFRVQDTGLGNAPAYDIQVTAANIASVANAYAGNTFLTAYYTSSTDDLPGKLRFDRLSLTAATFTISPSNTQCWEQVVPITSANEARANRVYFSKFNQPEAVPVVNYIEVGSVNQPIRRIVPLRDGVMVLKDDGVFRISNAAPPFTITPIDYNVRILAANTAAELDNNVYFLSDQGVVALSDSDTQIKSFILDKTIIENTSPTIYPNLSQTAWGIAYQSARKYILAMPTNSDDVQATQQYVYNHLTNVWTRWTLGATCGLVFKKDGKLYLGSVGGSAPGLNNNYVYQERKSFTTADYVDSVYVTNNTTAGKLTTIIVGNPVLPAGEVLLTGWTVQQPSTSASARIISVTPGVSFTTLVLDREQTWDVSAVNIFVPVYSDVQTVQIDCQNPGMNKQFTEIIYIFTEQSFSSLTAGISSNTISEAYLDTLVPVSLGGWGLDPWGTSAWGSGYSDAQGKIRRIIPQKIQRSGWLYINIANAECFTKFGWSGLDIRYNDTSTRQK